VEIKGSSIRFEFKGKSGKFHSIGLQDKKLSQLVKKCRDIPGQELFQYFDENKNCQSLGSADVNEYLRTISGMDFTAKDFRTWAGTVMAVSVLKTFEICDSESRRKKNLKEAIMQVADKLGNTVAICRKCYIHPIIIELFEDNTLASKISSYKMSSTKNKYALNNEERIVLKLLTAMKKLK
jgi:DNA topoisomerase-1